MLLQFFFSKLDEQSVAKNKITDGVWMISLIRLFISDKCCFWHQFSAFLDSFLMALFVSGGMRVN